MESNSFQNFLVFLYENKNIEFSLLPRIGLELSHEEIDQKVERIIIKICDLFKEKGIHFKSSPFYYALYSSNGTYLSEIKKFSSYSYDEQILYFSSFKSEDIKFKLEEERFKLECEQLKLKEELEVERLNCKEERKIKTETCKENSVLKLLSVNIKDSANFNFTIGNLDNIKREKKLEIAKKFSFNEEQKIEMLENIKFLKKMHKNHDFISESDTNVLITNIILIAVNFLEDFYVHNDYNISPIFKYIRKIEKGIDRRVDIAIYYRALFNIICLTEIKRNDSDINECIRQNADQIRAYCICNDCLIGRGIATTGMLWIFTEYEKSGEKFKVSKTFKIMDLVNEKVTFLETDFFVFFEILISFIMESYEIMNKLKEFDN